MESIVPVFPGSWYGHGVDALEPIIEKLAARKVAIDQAADAEGLRAAVAAVLRPGKNGAEILFIRRADRAGDPWSGHMAFPGGRREAHDTRLIDTATRETREEVGLDLRTARSITRLPDLLPHIQMPSPIIVTAFVFALDAAPVLRPNEEVAETIWAPLASVLQREPRATYPFRREGLHLDLPAIDLEGRIVWGLTYRMVEMLAEATA